MPFPYNAVLMTDDDEDVTTITQFIAIMIYSTDTCRKSRSSG